MGIGERDPVSREAVDGGQAKGVAKSRLCQVCSRPLTGCQRKTHSGECRRVWRIRVQKVRRFRREGRFGAVAD